MYSAESGEEFANYKEHPEDEFQLKFLSGVVRMVVAGTPLAFGTTKAFHVADRKVEDLLAPITIKLPVN